MTEIAELCPSLPHPFSLLIMNAREFLHPDVYDTRGKGSNTRAFLSDNICVSLHFRKFGCDNLVIIRCSVSSAMEWE